MGQRFAGLVAQKKKHTPMLSVRQNERTIVPKISNFVSTETTTLNRIKPQIIQKRFKLRLSGNFFDRDQNENLVEKTRKILEVLLGGSHRKVNATFAKMVRDLHQSPGKFHINRSRKNGQERGYAEGDKLFHGRKDLSKATGCGQPISDQLPK